MHPDRAPTAEDVERPSSPRILAVYIEDLEVQFISLVDKAANQRTLVYKAAGASASPAVRKTVEIAKVNDEQRLLIGVVYAPDEPDAHGEQMTAAEIQKAAHAFLKAARTASVDKQHDEQPVPGVAVVESYLTKADGEFDDEPAGTWVVAVHVEDDETWEAVKKGDITGFSMGGVGTKVEKSETSGGLIARAVRKGRELIGRVTKDYTETKAHNVLWNACSTLGWANDMTLWGDDGTPWDDPEAQRQQLLTNAEQFAADLRALDLTSIAKSAADGGSTQADEADSPTDMAKNENGEPTLADVMKGINALSTRLDAVEKSEEAPGGEPDTDEAEPTLADVMGKLDEMGARLDTVEKASRGRTSQRGSDDEPVEKSSYTGPRWTGGA